MTYGQGATMALPIFAYYMRRVYADKRLGYSESAVFDLPENYDPCESFESGDDGDMTEVGDEMIDIEEIFE